MSVYSRIGQNFASGYDLGDKMYETHRKRKERKAQEEHKERIISGYARTFGLDDGDYEASSKDEAPQQATALPDVATGVAPPTPAPAGTMSGPGLQPSGATVTAAEPAAAAPTSPAPAAAQQTPVTPAPQQASALPPRGAAPVQGQQQAAAAAPAAERWPTKKDTQALRLDNFAYHVRYESVDAAMKADGEFQAAQERRATRAMNNARAALAAGDNAAVSHFLTSAAKYSPDGYVPQFKQGSDGKLYVLMHDEESGAPHGDPVPVTADLLDNLEKSYLGVEKREEMALAERKQKEDEAAGAGLRTHYTESDKDAAKRTSAYEASSEAASEYNRGMLGVHQAGVGIDEYKALYPYGTQPGGGSSGAGGAGGGMTASTIVSNMKMMEGAETRIADGMEDRIQSASLTSPTGQKQVAEIKKAIARLIPNGPQAVDAILQDYATSEPIKQFYDILLNEDATEEDKARATKGIDRFTREFIIELATRAAQGGYDETDPNPQQQQYQPPARALPPPAVATPPPQYPQ